MTFPKEQLANELQVSRFVEWSNLEDLPQDFDAFTALGRQERAQSLQDLLLQLSEALSLAGDPVVEERRPVEKQAFEKLAAERRSHRSKIVWRSPSQRPRQAGRK